MSSRITIISHGSAFMTNALVNSLKKAGLYSTVIEPEIKNIGNMRGETDIYLLYAGDYVFDSTDVLVFLKDICAEDDKQLCVVGYEKEITEIKSSIHERFISREFARPFDMKDLTEAVSALAQADEERRKGRHILLVDDDPIFLKMMQDWLSMKYNITSVRSGMQAITYIATHKPDLVR